MVAAAVAAGIELGGLGQVGGLPAHSQEAGLVFGFASVTPAEIRRAVKALAQAWRPLWKPAADSHQTDLRRRAINPTAPRPANIKA
jgi:hypothetical protein